MPGFKGLLSHNCGFTQFELGQLEIAPVWYQATDMIKYALSMIIDVTRRPAETRTRQTAPAPSHRRLNRKADETI